MGSFFYGSAGERFEVAEETLAHLEAVVVAKLRRREDFTITFQANEDRQVVWMHPACNLRFLYDAPRVELDRARLDTMMKQLNKSTTMVVDVSTRKATASAAQG